MDTGIRETVQQVFDQHAAIVSKLKCKQIKPEPIRGQLVADTYKAMQSICKCGLPKSAQPPFWLEKHSDWEADDLLVFANGILNVRRYVQGESDHFIPRTPRLFFRHQATFGFDLNAPAPKHWLEFLDSLEQDDDWRTCLRQMMGYCCWAGYDLQKFFQLVGPKRCGKGTIAGVLEGLLGGPDAVCSPSLEDFGTRFGLENAMHRRLAVVPEATVPNNDVRKIVSRIKAITGGDLVSIEGKGVAHQSVRLKLKIILMSNEFIVLPDNSGAIHGRTFPLRFTKSFIGKEDLALADKLTAELPAILNWALEGVRSLLANNGHFTLPQSSQEELDELLTETAPLQAFIEDCCEVDKRLACHSVALYEVYRQWQEDRFPGEDRLADNMFPAELRKTVHTIRKDRMGNTADQHHKGCKIVKTRFDSPGEKRANLWLGIAPKTEWHTQRN